MQDRMGWNCIILQRDLHDHGLLLTRIDSDVPYCAGALDICSEYQAVSTARNHCGFGRVGQGNDRFACEEDHPSTVVEIG